MNALQLIQIIAGATIPLTIIAVIINRCYTKKGIGVRIVQLTTAAMIIPTVLILTLEKALDGSAASAIIGGIIGYMFSNISEYDKSKNSDLE